MFSLKVYMKNIFYDIMLQTNIIKSMYVYYHDIYGTDKNTNEKFYRSELHHKNSQTSLTILKYRYFN